MKTRPLKNYKGSIGCEVYDIDLMNCTDEEIVEIGKIVEDQCNVFINSPGLTKEKHYKIMTQWGTPSRALVHNWLVDKKVSGPHWRNVLANIGYVARGIHDKDSEKDMSPGMSYVSFRKDENGRPIGIFANGELTWHSDQCALDDAPRVNGLLSLSDSANSQTDFLQTYDVWERLSSDMQSMIKELRVKHIWRPKWLAGDLDLAQQELTRYNMVAVDGQETPLYSETANGRPGIKFPSYTFNGFVGMNDAESWQLHSYLSSLIYDPQWIYQHQWQDGQVMYFDQSICLHRRPTNITDGNKRLMSRVVVYMDKLYPDEKNKPRDYVLFEGKKLSHDEFVKVVDADRLEKFKNSKELY
jgi:alpha-ketoglutarate-dependent taurine dioxygenase